jgi:hypothetical protein
MSFLSNLGGMVKGVTGALNPVAPIIGGALSYFGGKEQNVASAEAAQRQMAFQREASDTSYQRQVADLKSAGINPMLVAKLGGATTPGGAMPQFVNPGAMAAQAYSAAQSSGASAQQAETSENLSMQQMRQIDAATDKIREEIKNIPTEGERLKQMVFVLNEQEYLYRAQGFESQERQRMLAETVKKLVEETKVVGAEASAIQSLNNLGREYGQMKPLIDTIIGVMKGLK